MTRIKRHHTLEHFYEMYPNPTELTIILASVYFIFSLGYCCRRLQCNLDGRPCELLPCD